MILRHKEDRAPILFTLGFLSLQFSCYWWELFWVWPFLAFGCGILGAINHNQMHSPAFSSKKLNSFWNFVLSWGMGASATQITVTHILVHHRYFRDERDWTGWRLAQGRGMRRWISYLRNSIQEISKNRKSFMASPLNSKWVAAIRRERVVLWVGALSLFAFSPWAFALNYALPWALGLMLVLVVNLIQHDGLDLQSTRHSRDFTSPIANWLTFNSFFHTVHHDRPSLHWSCLPKEHVRRGLTGENSFCVYIWSEYISVPWK